MNPLNNNIGMHERRLLTISDGAAYVSMGRNTFRTWIKQIGAERRFGRRVMCDRFVIDRCLSEMGKNEDS